MNFFINLFQLLPIHILVSLAIQFIADHRGKLGIKDEHGFWSEVSIEHILISADSACIYFFFGKESCGNVGDMFRAIRNKG